MEGEEVSHTVYLVQYYATTSPDIMEECDRVMAALVAMDDDTVTDPAVAADAELGIIGVECIAEGRTREDAERAALARIAAAMDAAGLQVVERSDMRVLESV